MPLANDERGWIMTGLSGLACIFGASFICVDIIVRQFPGKRDFRIQDSDVFLSVSLSLSFGVMLFSALYSMLPSAKKSLQEGGFTAKEASWILIGCFIGGVLGIQVVSRVLHHFIPSHVVDCEHSHEEEEDGIKEDASQGHRHRSKARKRHSCSHHGRKSTSSANGPMRSRNNSTFGHAPATQPLNEFETSMGEHSNGNLSQPTETQIKTDKSDSRDELSTQRPSLHTRITASISQLASGKKASCDSNGPCYGFAELCGKDCFKIVNARGGMKIGGASGTSRPAGTRTVTATESTPLLHQISEEQLYRPRTQAAAEGAATSHLKGEPTEPGFLNDNSAVLSNHDHGNGQLHKIDSHESSSSEQSEQSEHPEHHHHHVPANAFLSIGLQTSIAIAIHKLPEGFITFATNHANPKLGVSVFLALFIHNITEGFAMALPLYLAINNRIKAMLVSFVLGGLSQPIGAGVAALWFKLAGNTNFAPSEAVYGGMFAVTAGILASVALQLFSESLDLTHSKGLCMIGAFSGMAILGISSALTA